MTPQKPWACGAGVHIPLSPLGPPRGLEGDQSVQPSLFPMGCCRVRSIIMLQEKAQDRERLLLKFIKIMKVTVAALPRVSSFGPCPAALGLPHGRLPSFCSTYGS